MNNFKILALSAFFGFAIANSANAADNTTLEEKEREAEKERQTIKNIGRLEIEASELDKTLNEACRHHEKLQYIYLQLIPEFTKKEKEALDKVLNHELAEKMEKLCK